jgi:CHU_C Type IX secretion signal domain/PKD domain
MSRSWKARSLVVSIFLLRLAAFGGSPPGFSFIKNKTQWPEGIEFSTKVPGGNLYLEHGVWTFSFLDKERIQRLHEQGHHTFRENPVRGGMPCIDGVAIKFAFEGANKLAEAQPFGLIPTTYNYFVGNDPSRWSSDNRAYEGVVYSSFYPGIDLKISGDGTNLKYDFIVAAEADPSCITVKYSGARKTWLDQGDVIIESQLATLIEKKPVAYQRIHGVRKLVPCQYTFRDDAIGYVFPNGYDACEELVIDPLLIFSTYSGSTADNWGSTATPAEHGMLYSSGVTSEYVGGFFPATAGSFQVNYGGLFDVALLKYDSLGENLLYASYLGGSDSESPHSLVMNSQNELLVLGTTSSANFPTTSVAIDRSYNGGTYDYNVISYDFGSDIFVAKVSQNGNQLMASTFLGGSSNDGLNPSGGLLVANYGDELRGDIIADNNGNIFISTVSSSPDFPVMNSFGTTFHGGATDAVIMELNSSLSQMIWGAFLGGGSSDASHTIKLDQAGNIFVAGGTGSSDFPASPTSYQPSLLGSADGWIAHLAGDGSSILAATYTGTIDFDQVYIMDINQQQEVYVFGQTAGKFPVTSGVYSNPNSGQFIQKFDNGLTTLQFSTVFGSGGGIPDISPTAFLVNDCNNLYMTGWGGELNIAEGFWDSNTVGMPISNDAFQKTTRGSDFYFMVLTSDAKNFVYGTYMGGPYSRTHVDGGTSRFDKKGIVYHAVCSGCAALNVADKPTSDFPTTATAHSRVNKSANCNNAAFKFDLASLRAIIQTNSVSLRMPGYHNVCLPDKIVFQNKSIGGESFVWTLGDGTVVDKSDTSLITHQYPAPGQYIVKLEAIDAGTCIGKDSTIAIVNVFVPQGKVGPGNVICFGSSQQLIATGGVSYSWLSADSSFKSTLAQPVVTPKDSTEYFAKITDVNNCTVTDTVKIGVIPGADLSFKSSLIYDCFTRPSLHVQNLTDPKSNSYFDFGDGTKTDSRDEVHQYQKDGTYAVKVVAMKDFCTFDNLVNVPVYELKIPNVITPVLTPGANDTFMFLYGSVPLPQSGVKASVTIYNRWGKLVYQDSDYQGDWAAENVPAGVFYYEAEIEGVTTCKGWVQVIK